MTPRRLILLDALRALAGLSVPLFHLFEPLSIRKGGAPIPILVGHGYLAVEFFLLLMGYMLGYAYDRRWAEGLGLWGFFKRRLVRLHPLVISGVLLGLAVALLQPHDAAWMPWFRGVSPLETVGLALWSATLLPVIGFGMINPFNACSWTLSYEYAGNILYALVIRHFSKVLLAVASLVAALFWLDFAFDGTLEKGWNASAAHCYGGFVRLAFPLFFGLLLARLGWKIRLPKGVAWLVPAVFAAVLFTPHALTASGPAWINPTFEACALMVVFPLLILVGVGSEAPAPAPLERAITFLAELSYPLYMSHYMFMAPYNVWARLHSATLPDAAVKGIVAAIYLALVAFAVLVMLFWDRPIRHRLTFNAQLPRKETNNP